MLCRKSHRLAKNAANRTRYVRVVVRFEVIRNLSTTMKAGRTGLTRPVCAMAENFDFVRIVGVPVSVGQPLVGVENGPQIIRKHGLHKRLAEMGWRLDDVGDITVPHRSIRPKASKYSDVISHVNRQLAEHVHTTQTDDRARILNLNLGGDHSLGLGSVAGQLKAHGDDLGLVWVDAHADINTVETSASGNWHGMVVSMLLRLLPLSHPKLEDFAWLQDYPVLKPENLVYVGLRDVDAPEVEILRENNIKCFSMFEIDKYGIGRVMEMVEDHLCGVNPNKPVHLTFDIDACDPYFAPSTGTAVRGGLSFRESHFICEESSRFLNLVGLDMAEVNPNLADQNSAEETANTAVSLIASGLGERIVI